MKIISLIFAFAFILFAQPLTPASQPMIIRIESNSCSTDPDTSFRDASRATGIMRSDLIALASIESEMMQARFSKHSLHWESTRSSSGALGIMQIKPDTWDWMDCTGSIHNRRDNVLCAARYLSRIRRMRCSQIPGRSQLRCMVAHYHDGHNKRGEFSLLAINHVRKFIRAVAHPVFI